MRRADDAAAAPTRTDVRVLVAEAERDARRRLQRRGGPGVVLFAVLGGASVAAGVTTVDPRGLGIGLWFLAMGVTGGLALALRHRGAGPRVVDRTRAGATRLRRPAGAFRAGLAMLGVVALMPWGLIALGTGRLWNGGVPVLLGLLLALPALAALTGRYVAGELVLSRDTLRYRHLGFEATVTWDDVAVVSVSEPTREVRLRLLLGRSARTRHRAGPLRGQRAETDGSVVLRLDEWGLLATDVARLVLHYAARPADRAELGTPAARERLERLRALRVDQRLGQWLVGRDTGLEDRGPSDRDAALPVWRTPPGDVGTDGLLAMYRGQALAVLAAVSLAFAWGAWEGMAGAAGAVAAVALVVAAVAFGVLAFSAPRRRPSLDVVDVAGPVSALDGVVLRRPAVPPRLLATALAGSGTAAGALVAHTAGTWPVVLTVVGAGVAVALVAPAVLLATRKVSVGELRLDEDGLAYRSRASSFTARWVDVARVDAMTDDVVRVERRDGVVGRLDLRGMLAGAYFVTIALATYARQGSPRGDTRSLEVMRLRLLGRG